METDRVANRSVSQRRILIAHLRLVLIDTFRDPAALIGNIIIPAVCFIFFVLPNRDVVNSEVASTEAVLQLTSMLGFSTCLFGYSASVAQDRESGFGVYLRTLPVGTAPRFIAIAVGAISVTVVGLMFLWIMALFFTEASLTPSLFAGFLGLTVTMITWSLFGASLGQVFSVKTVITVAQLLFLVLAFGGGMLVDPRYMPDALNSVSRYLPSRASRDIVVELGAGENLQMWTIGSAVFWLLCFGTALLVTVRLAKRR